MNIQVSLRMTIAELQQAFSNYFPYLSLSFFTKPRTVYQSAPAKYYIAERGTPLEQLELQPHYADVDIQADMTGNDLEQLFEQEFGLHLQVSCQDGSFWTEDTGTDNISLRMQNDNAAQARNRACLPVRPVEYHDTRTEWYLG